MKFKKFTGPYPHKVLIAPADDSTLQQKALFHHCSGGSEAVTEEYFNYVGNMLIVHGEELEGVVEDEDSSSG